MSAFRRREALLAAVAAPLAFTSDAAAASGDQQAQSKAVLLAALRLEQTATVAYEAIANSGAVGARPTALLREFRDQDGRHADQLSNALDALGAKVPIPPRRVDIPGLARVRDKRSALSFAIALEQRTVATYGRLVQVVTDPNLLRTCAGAMGTDGQQLAVLRELAGENPVPTAFAAGARR